MAADEPPYLTVGTDVSAKYKGAFCEAKVKKVNRLVKCKVNFKNNQGTMIVTDDKITKGTLRVGAHVEAVHPEKNQPMEAIISKLFDYSQYTVVFDDGDETTLRRTSLCLKSGRHFAESETLDQLPLTNPEHFGTPVMGSKTKRKRRSATTAVAVMNFQRARRAHSSPIFASLCRDEESSDEEPSPKKSKESKVVRERDPDIGKVVCVEVGDKRRKDSWFPGLVVSPTAQESIKICMKDDYLVRSFKDGKYYPTMKKDTREFTKEIGSKIDSTMLKTAVEKALQYLDNDELPPHWDRDLLMGLNVPSTAEVTDTDSDTSDDEPSEEKDRFVAQLYKFMDERGTPINKAPTIGSRDLNLYKLFKLVSKMGGYNRVTNQNQWKTVYTKMGLPASNPSSSHQIKQAYKKYLHSFEDFYRKLGCTMVTNIRSSRVRHRSDRNFIITRNRDRETSGQRGKKEVKEKNKSDDKSKDDDDDEEDDEEQDADDDDDDKNEDGEQQEQEEESVSDEKREDEKEPQDLSPAAKEEDEEKDENDKTKEEDEDEDEEEEEEEEEEADISTEDIKKEKDEVGDVKQGTPEKQESGDAKIQAGKEKERTPKLKDRSPKEKDGKTNRKERKVKDEKKKVVKEKDDKKGKERKERQKKKDGDLERRERREKAADKKERDGSQEGKRGKNTDLKKEERNVRSKGKRDGSPMVKKQLKRSSSKIDDKHVDSEKSKSNNDDASDKSDSGSSNERNDKGKTERTEKVERDISSVQIGDRVRVRYGARKQQKIYEAKVVKMDEERGFFVHYTGWNVRYDEWVKKSRIVEIVTDKALPGKKKKQGVGVVTKSLQVNRVFKRGRTASGSAGKASSPVAVSSTQTGSAPRKSSIRSSSPSPVAKSRSMRSDRNSLSESPFASGLEPRKRIRRKSGVSGSNQDSFQSLENYSEPGASDTEDTSKDGMQVDDDDANTSDDKSEANQGSENKTDLSKKSSESDDSTEEELTPAIPELEPQVGIPDEKEDNSLKEADDVMPPPAVLEEPLNPTLDVAQPDEKQMPVVVSQAPVIDAPEHQEVVTAEETKPVLEDICGILPQGQEMLVVKDEKVVEVTIPASEVAVVFKEEVISSSEAPQDVIEQDVPLEEKTEEAVPQVEPANVIQDVDEAVDVAKDNVVKNEELILQEEPVVSDQIVTLTTTEETHPEVNKVVTDVAVYELGPETKDDAATAAVSNNSKESVDKCGYYPEPQLPMESGTSPVHLSAPSLVAAAPPTLPIPMPASPIPISVSNEPPVIEQCVRPVEDMAEPEMVEEEIHEEEFPLLVMDTAKIAQVQQEINAEEHLMSPLSNEESIDIPSIEEQSNKDREEICENVTKVGHEIEAVEAVEIPVAVDVEAVAKQEEARISLVENPITVEVTSVDIPSEEVSQVKEEPSQLDTSLEEAVPSLPPPPPPAPVIVADVTEKKEDVKDQSIIKKEGKKEKKLKAGKEKKHLLEMPSDKQDSKKIVKHRVKRKAKADIGDADGSGLGGGIGGAGLTRDEGKMKVKKAKKLKSKKIDSKIDSDDEKDISIGTSSELENDKVKKKDKRKKEDKKMIKIQSDGEKDDGSGRKEKKKARKNRDRMLVAEKKRDDSAEKRPKKKKKMHMESDLDVDIDKEVPIYLGNESPASKTPKKEKKREKKKLKGPESPLGDDSSELLLQKESISRNTGSKQGKLLSGHFSPIPIIAASTSTSEGGKDEEYDQDTAFLLCEEKVPASPVPEDLPVEFTSQPPTLSFANTVTSQSCSNQILQCNPSTAAGLADSSNSVSFQPEVLGPEPVSSGGRHESEVSSVLDNTPPTTPESTESVASSSPPHEHENRCVQDARSSGESTEEESYVPQERPTPMAPVESEDGSSRTESTLSSSSIVHDKPKESLSRGASSLKRHRNDAEEGVHKKRRSRKRTHSSSEGSKANTRHRNNSTRGMKDGDEYAMRQSENHSIGSNSSCSSFINNNSNDGHGINGTSFACPTSSPASMMSVLPTRPSKYNFCDPLDDCMDADKRISILQERLAELRKTYMALKAEVALIDRRRKKAKKKEKETASANTAPMSNGSHAVEVHCAS